MTLEQFCTNPLPIVDDYEHYEEFLNTVYPGRKEAFDGWLEILTDYGEPVG